MNVLLVCIDEVRIDVSDDDDDVPGDDEHDEVSEHDKLDEHMEK